MEAYGVCPEGERQEFMVGGAGAGSGEHTEGSGKPEIQRWS